METYIPPKAKEVIKKLELVPLPEEGGYYNEIYRSSGKFFCDYKSIKKDKNFCTSIYYLVTQEDFSALHRLDQDEIFHFYTGSPGTCVEMLQIEECGKHKIITLGSDVLAGEQPQVIAPGNVWQGTTIKGNDPEAWALLGCTVAPGFDFEDFILADKSDLLEKYPHLKDLIIRFMH